MKQIVEGLIWRTTSDPVLPAGAKKMYFFFVNRQAVACWRPMPSNLNLNYIQLTLTILGTLSYNQDKPTCLATETS